MCWVISAMKASGSNSSKFLLIGGLAFGFPFEGERAALGVLGITAKI